MYSPVWPHSEIKELFPGIFYVVGTNITRHNNIELQHSRNMIIIRDQDSLSLLNTVRLSEEGFAQLDRLGKVEHVVKIGSFHGRDDAFYLDRYKAKLWLLKGMQHDDSHRPEFLVPDNKMPFADCSLFVFETSTHPEGILHIAKHGGILITCDSIKNWLKADQFFSEESAKLYEAQGFFGIASISAIWKQACNVAASDFIRLKSLKFQHLISAHGDPLIDTAYKNVAETIRKEYGV